MSEAKAAPSPTRQPIPQMKIAEMQDFVGVLCWSCGVKGDVVPAEAVIAMPGADIARIVAIKRFFDQIEPFSDQVRNVVRTRGGAVR